jgi:hypothetical protein
MSHYSTEFLGKERIANWQREADMARLARSGLEPEPSMHPASSWRHGALDRLTGWLAPVRRFVARVALAA